MQLSEHHLSSSYQQQSTVQGVQASDAISFCSFS